MMIEFNNDTIQTNDTSTDLKTLGEIDISTLWKSTIPIYLFQMSISGAFVMKNDPNLCGGDCLDYLETHLDISYA